MNLLIKPEVRNVKLKTSTATIHTLFINPTTLCSPGNLTFLLSSIFTSLTLSSGQSCIFLSIHVLHFDIYHLGPSFCHEIALIHFAAGLWGLGDGRIRGLCSARTVEGLKEKNKPSIVIHVLKLRN